MPLAAESIPQGTLFTLSLGGHLLTNHYRIRYTVSMPSDSSHLTPLISPSSPRCWFAIRTKPRQEAVARDQLQNQGFEVYLPMVNTRISHARKVSWQPRPFFAGYLFMCLTKEEQRWTTIRSTIGVLAPVVFGSFYPPLPEVAISVLKGTHDEQGFVTVDATPAAPFKAGEKVRLNSGSLTGFDALFVEMRGEDRALVLLDWMQTKMRVVTSTSNLVAKR